MKTTKQWLGGTKCLLPQKKLSSTHSAKVLHLGSTLVTVQGPAWKASAFPRETWTWKSWKMVPLLYVCWQNRQLSTWVTAKPSVLRTWHQNQRNCYKPRWGVSMERLSKLKPEDPNFPEMLYVSCQGLPMTPWLCGFQMVALPNGLVADMCCLWSRTYWIKQVGGGALTKAQNISKHDVVATHAPRNNM